MDSGSVRALACLRTGIKRRTAAVLLALTVAGLGVPLAAGTATAATANGATAGGADLAVTETVSSATPDYYTAVTFTTTVTNTTTTRGSFGISVAATVPAGLIKPVKTPSQGIYYARAGKWVVGSLARGASATLTITGFAGAVALGTQTVTASVTAKTPDPNPGNNTASASEASQPAPIAATITPSPDNPPFIDISQPGDVSWTGGAVNAANPSAPAPPFTGVWSCSTVSFNPCPPDLGTGRTLEYLISSFSIDTYTITFFVEAKGTNYTGAAQTSDTFTTIISGG
jgi:hypothetical protein